MTSREAASYSYAVFSLLTDETRGQSVPVGVALWSPQRRWAKVRLLGAKERLTGFNPKEHAPLVRLIGDKVEHWIQTGRLPYAEPQVPHYDDRWWRHARELLIHRVRLSEPRPIDCRDPEEELEPLYESVVAPHRSAREQRTRIDGEIRKCLNSLAEKFEARQTLPGFGGRSVTVLRAYQGARGWVVIEGINMAASQAEVQADATASKLLRLRSGLDQDCRILVGYLSSPEGLNGESVLIEWLEQKTGAHTFDLMKQRADFHVTADRMVAQADGQESLFPPSS